jgi:trigger factor
MGIQSGDLAKLRDDVRKNLEREVINRCKTRTKSSVMDVLLAKAEFEIPQALIQSESERLAESTRADLAARGMNVKDAPIPADLFRPQAERRVKLGLLVGEIVKKHELQATEAQVRSLIEEMASAYEDPKGFVDWYMGQPKQRAEAEAVVIEDNVVAWALAKAAVGENTVTVEGLMAEAAKA